MRTVTFKIEDDVLELLDSYAIEHRLYRSEAIREAIEFFIREKMKESVTKQAKVEKGYKLR
jgi:metal-responsive CopG/Arc/MetJ family transcriptional regulator